MRIARVSLLSLLSTVISPPTRACTEAILKAVWDSDNIRFYENLPPDAFEARSATCGMNRHPDLFQPRLAHLLGIANPLAETPTMVAEIGGGFGRVVDFLVEKTTIPVIFVIERSMRYSARLRRKYEPRNGQEGYRRVRIHPYNVLNLPGVDKTYGFLDVVLWLWYGYAELHPDDKPKALGYVFQTLKKGGTFVVDQPVSVPISTAVTKLESEFAHFSMSDEPGAPVLHLHRFTRDSLIKGALAAGFKFVACDEYVVPSNPRSTIRALCFFQKPF